jgi:hypothetical protein
MEAVVEDTDNVRVVDPGNGLRLDLESVPHGRVCGDALSKQLDRNKAV